MRYSVVSGLIYRSHLYLPEQTVEVADGDADELLAIGAIAPIPDTDAEDEKPKAVTKRRKRDEGVQS